MAQRPNTISDILCRLQLLEPTVLDTGCWKWTLGLTAWGYGSVSYKAKTHSAHLFVYEILIGPRPSGLVADHLCRNRWCCNPYHLEFVTHQVNVLRGIGPPAKQAKRNECPAGHPYAGDNLYLTPKGHRVCRTCQTEKRRLRNGNKPKATTHCLRGHSLDGKNLRVHVDKDGQVRRFCRECARLRAIGYRQRKHQQ